MFFLSNGQSWLIGINDLGCILALSAVPSSFWQLSTFLVDKYVDKLWVVAKKTVKSSLAASLPKI